MGPSALLVTEPQLHGRERHVAQINANLQAVTNSCRSKVLLVEAVSGAGKSRLLREASAIGRRAGFTVIGACSEVASPAPVSPCGRSGERLVASFPGGSHPEVGANTLVEALRARLDVAPGPGATLVAVDDLNVAGLPALTDLCDLVVRMGGRPVLWVLAFTTGRDSATRDPVKSFLGTLRGRIQVEPMRDLGPLADGALTNLVAECAGASPGPDLLDLAEGVNTTPRAVIDLVRGLIADGGIQTVGGSARLHTDALAGAPIGTGLRLPPRVPPRFSAMVRRDLSGLSEPTLKALRLAAVLGSPFAPEDLSALLGEAPVGLLSAVDEAVNRGLLICSDHDLVFRSESVWRVLLDTVPGPVCALLRRQAADLLAARPDGLERAAIQLAHVARPGDTKSLGVITKGATRLLAVDPLTAGVLASRGMELLAPGHPERVRLARTAVEAFTRAGELDQAITLARQTIDETAPPLAVPGARPPATRSATPGGPVADLTADTVGEVAALRGSMSAALLLLGKFSLAQRAASDALADSQEDTQYREAVITNLAVSYIDGDRVGDRARTILNSPDRHAHTIRAGALTFQACGQWRNGRVRDSVATLREAVAVGQGDAENYLLDPRWFLAFALTRTDEFEEAAAVIESCARSAGTKARTVAATVPALLRASLLLARGRLAEAESAAKIVLGADGLRIPTLAPQAWLVLAHVALRRGALGEAVDHLRSLEMGFPRHTASPWAASRLLLDAQLAQMEGELEEVGILREAVAEPATLRALLLEDSAVAAWCVRSALVADLPDQARTVVDTMEWLRTHNQDVPVVTAAACHARALLDRDAEGMGRAARLHRNPWAKAAAVEDLAELLLARHDSEAAIVELDRAMTAYSALGAERDAARVRARLRGLGVRRRHWTRTNRPLSGWESLTTTERKVAELVASGLTNQQAARQLFISPHTVGFHLRQIYRKLDIRSRTALVRIKA